VGIVTDEAVAFGNGRMDKGLVRSRVGMALSTEETSGGLELERSGDSGMSRAGGDMTDAAVADRSRSMDKIKRHDGPMAIRGDAAVASSGGWGGSQNQQEGDKGG
jgi:hypothetical protein